MGAELNIDVKGVDKIVNALTGKLDPALKRASLAIATTIHERIAPYPPATEANSPRDEPPYWYERGFGTRTKSGKGRRTSETLGRKWSIQPRGTIGAAVTNPASYAPYVHDYVEQAWFHAQRGWKTDEEVTRSVESDGTAERYVNHFVAQILDDD
jgi:hypothetical protein